MALILALVTNVPPDGSVQWERIPKNKWTPVDTAGYFPAYRVDHSGAIYVEQEDAVYWYGADTHGHSTNRTDLLALDIDSLRWSVATPNTHEMLRVVSASQRRQSGWVEARPWPMHVYDAMAVDDSGSILLASGAKHHAKFSPLEQYDPFWTFSTADQHWKEYPGGESHSFFANSVLYDERRDRFVGINTLASNRASVGIGEEDSLDRNGVWANDVGSADWELIGSGPPHWGWFNAEIDQTNDQILLFGGTIGSELVWRFSLSENKWRAQKPSGERCTMGFYPPAATNDKGGYSLVLVTDRRLRRTSMCIYHHKSDQMQVIPDPGLPYIELNYNLVFVARHNMFLLITGSYATMEPTQVWVLRV